MPRYINEDEFCEYIRKNTTPSGAEWFISKIKDMPDADVVEVKHGEWVKSGQSFLHPEKFVSYCCSECGYEDTEKNKYNFCPNCGADMRERKKTE